MNAFLLSVALLGELNPLVKNMFDETNREHTERAVQTQRDTAARSIAYDNRESDTKNTYIIAGAIVGGLFLFGLLARSGKK